MCILHIFPLLAGEQDRDSSAVILESVNSLSQKRQINQVSTHSQVGDDTRCQGDATRATNSNMPTKESIFTLN